MRVRRGEPLVGQAGHVEVLEEGHRVGGEDLLDALVRPPRPLPSSDVGHLEIS